MYLKLYNILFRGFWSNNKDGFFCLFNQMKNVIRKKFSKKNFSMATNKMAKATLRRKIEITSERKLGILDIPQ